MKALQTNKSRVKNIQSSAPTNVKAEFKIEELFFSITDSKSTIKYANDTFIRISKFEKQEMIGHLHKIVRHPDMPKSVFKIFWDFLESDTPICAYVKNKSKDGSYYWVLALAFPFEDGYISIRIKPTSDLFGKVKAIYADVLSYEKEITASNDQRKATQAAESYLIQQLQKQGFHDYNHFMWIALQKEMQLREATLKELSSKKASNNCRLKNIEHILSQLVMNTDSLSEMHESIDTASNNILTLSRSILLLSINAQVGSAKLDKNDKSLSVVAENMGEQSVQGETNLNLLKKAILDLNELVGTLNFDIIAAKLQVEMYIYYQKEIESSNSINNSDAFESSEILKRAFSPRIDQIVENIDLVNSYLQTISYEVEQVSRFLMVLRFIHITGRVEVARMVENTTSFTNTFQELIDEINSADGYLKNLKEIVNSNQSILKMNTKLTQDLSKATRGS